MAKIKRADIEKLIAENEIELKSTHAKLCIPIIDRIYKKMLASITFSEIRFDGNQICDGHHRYIASLLANVEIGRVEGCSTSATELTDWKSVVFVDEDWDTEAKIRELNEQDAKFNNMSIGELAGLLEKM